MPTPDGIPVDCDGSFTRFADNLHRVYRDDLRYVVEKYFEQVLLMLERGGFHLLGHLDKIAANASQADPSIEDQPWYAALIDDVLRHALDAQVAVEVNTKAFEKTGRFFPDLRWWTCLKDYSLTPVVDSDAHWPDKINAGRQEAFAKMCQFDF